LSLAKSLFMMAVTLSLTFLPGCTPAGGEPTVPQTSAVPIPLSTIPGRIVVAETFTGEW
jgi:hypothetical protein